MKKNIQFLKNSNHELDMLKKNIRNLLGDDVKLEILEAGCGRRWGLDLGEIKYTLTGLDINEHALNIRKDKRKDLDIAILGDLVSADLECDKYDVIYNSFVLEHVEGAEKVLDNFVKWLRPGGILILKIPDRNSVVGYLTRILPFSAHVFYKKYIQGIPNAGKPGHDPFPTYFEDVVSRKGIYKYCEDHGLEIKEEFASDADLKRMYKRLGVLSVFIKLFMKVIQIGHFGKLAIDYNNLTYVIKK